MESHDEERLMYKNLTFGNATNPNHNAKNSYVALGRMQTATTCGSCGGAGETLSNRPEEADAQGSRGSALCFEDRVLRAGISADTSCG